MRSACDQGGHEVIVPGGGLALALEAGFQRGVGGPGSAEPVTFPGPRARTNDREPTRGSHRGRRSVAVETEWMAAAETRMPNRDESPCGAGGVHGRKPPLARRYETQGQLPCPAPWPNHRKRECPAAGR